MTSTDRPHELDTWIRQTTSEMASEYERIRVRATEDPGTAGDEGEENWAKLLREWLPAGYQVRTKGRILAHDGTASRQVDVVVLRPGYPTKLLDKKLYVASGVAAAFECKLTLTAAHVIQATQTAVAIARMTAPREGTPYRELVNPIVYGLLSHSHGWSSQPVAFGKLQEHLSIGDAQHASHPRESLDIICVADTCVALKSIWLNRAWREIWRQHGVNTDDIYPLMSHVGYSFGETTRPPVGSMLAYLLIRLGWEDPQVRPFADYFRLARILNTDSAATSGTTKTGLTPATEAAVLAMAAENPRQKPWSWDEWGFTLE